VPDADAVAARRSSKPRFILLLAVVTAVLLSVPTVIPGLIGTLASWLLIGTAVYFARRRTPLWTRWLVLTPAAVALALTAAFVRRELAVYLAIVGGETAMVGAAAAIGTALASRRAAA
jgi:hypothetical protein